MNISDFLKDKNNRLYLAICLIILVFGVYLRVDGIQHRSLEYDEIWTLGNYVTVSNSKIFTDVATPNNHPLNSFLIKYSIAAFGLENWVVRLPSLIAGILLLPLAWLTARCVTGSNLASLIALTACVMNGALIHFSSTGRGYSMQTFFVFLAVASVMLYKQAEPRGKTILLLLLFVGAAGSCLSVSSGIIFILSAAASYALFFIDFRELKNELIEYRAPAIIFLLSLAGALCWYGMNYAQFKAGSKFGTDVASFQPFITFAASVICAFAVTVPLILLACGLFGDAINRKTVGFCLMFTAFSMLSALFTLAGPPRVYLPVIPVIALGAAAGFAALEKMFSRKKIYSAAVAVTAVLFMSGTASSSLEKWLPPDWGNIIPEIVRNVPGNVMIAYSSGDTYPMRVLCEDTAVLDFMSRCSRGLEFLMTVNTSGHVSVLDSSKNTVAVKIPAEPVKSGTLAKGVSFEMYKLRKPHKGEDVTGKMVMFTVSPVMPEIFNRIRAAAKHYSVMNVFLNRSMNGTGRNDCSYGAFLMDSGLKTMDTLIDFESENSGIIRFYIVE